MKDSGDAVRRAAEAATEAARLVLEASGLKYAGVVVVAELPKGTDETVQTGCWACVRDEDVLDVVKATLQQALERMLDYEPVAPEPPGEAN